jgi:Do/DeqQ family serine protease
MKIKRAKVRNLSLLSLLFLLFSFSTYSLTDQEQFAKIAEDVMPSVVNIRTKTVVTQTVVDPFQQFFYGESQPRQVEREGASLGSGFVIDEKGVIVTNNHVIKDATEVYVKFDNGKEYSAKILGGDAFTDIAVLQIEDAKEKFKPVVMGDSDKLKVGYWAIAIGNPFGLNSSMTLGIISSTGRREAGLERFANYIQTDAPINPGNSGGPLINIDGKVVGVNTAIISNSGGSIGLGFAIPINMVKKIAVSIEKHGEVIRPLLGVRFEPNFDSKMSETMGLEVPTGALIAEVIDDSPAQKAGLKRRDIILSIDGKEIRNYAQAVSMVGAYQPGDELELRVYRKEGLRAGKERVVKAVLASRDDTVLAQQGTFILGMKLQTLDKDLREKYKHNKKLSGVAIVEVDRSSQAAKQGLKEGDLILEINNTEIKSLKEFKEIYEKSEDKSNVLLYIIRNGFGGYYILNK